MRQLALLAVTIPLAIVSVVNPQIGLLGYVWFSLMRPDYLAYSVGLHGASEWLALGVLLGSWRFLANAGRAWITNPYSRWLLLLQIPLFLSTRTALYPEYSLLAYWQFLRACIMALMVPLLITKIDDLKKLYLVTAFSVGIYGLRDGVTGVLHGGLRIWSGIGGFMSDNNTYACGVLMALPFCWYSARLVANKWLRAFFLAMALGCIGTVVLTFSRGAAVAMAVVLLLIALEAKRKALTVAGLLVLGALPAFYLVHNQYLNRLATIATYEEDASAMSRIFLMHAALRVWQDHPLLGAGYGQQNFYTASAPYVPDPEHPIVVHNSYLEVLAESGLFACFIYICLLASCLWGVWRSSRYFAKIRPELVFYPRAIQASLVGFLICSATQPRFQFDLTYYVLMYAAAWHNIAREVSTSTPPGLVGGPVGATESAPAWARPALPFLRPLAGNRRPLGAPSGPTA